MGQLWPAILSLNFLFKGMVSINLDTTENTYFIRLDFFFFFFALLKENNWMFLCIKGFFRKD